jgi:hypothetical protein
MYCLSTAKRALKTMSLKLNIKSSGVSHLWNPAPQYAIALQRQLARRVIGKSAVDPANFQTIAGIDAIYRDQLVTAAVVAVNIQNLEIVGGFRSPMISIKLSDNFLDFALFIYIFKKA